MWCKNEKKNYKTRNLPFGKPLTCQDFRHALENIFLKYAARADVLAVLGSTQVNENVNHMVSTLHISVFVFVGDTYQSKIGIEEDVDLKDIDPTPVSFPKDGSEIIFDLETTGLGK